MVPRSLARLRLRETVVREVLRLIVPATGATAQYVVWRRSCLPLLSSARRPKRKILEAARVDTAKNGPISSPW